MPLELGLVLPKKHENEIESSNLHKYGGRVTHLVVSLGGPKNTKPFFDHSLLRFYLR